MRSPRSRQSGSRPVNYHKRITRAGLRPSIKVPADERRAYTTCIENFRIRAFFLIIELLK